MPNMDKLPNSSRSIACSTANLPNLPSSQPADGCLWGQRTKPVLAAKLCYFHLSVTTAFWTPAAGAQCSPESDVNVFSCSNATTAIVATGYVVTALVSLVCLSKSSYTKHHRHQQVSDLAGCALGRLGTGMLLSHQLCKSALRCKLDNDARFVDDDTLDTGNESMQLHDSLQRSSVRHAKMPGCFSLHPKPKLH